MAQVINAGEIQGQTAAEGGAAGSTPTVEAQSPFCRELRSKKYYFLQETPTEDHHILDVTNHCWCRQTMQAIGPDGERAHATDCKAERACFRAL